MKTFTLLILTLFFGYAAIGQAIIADHTVAKKSVLEQIPDDAITQAKANLHIAYGHTSHGSQITSGMSGLVGFMNGLGATENLYTWNETGADGALHLLEGDGYGDGVMDHDAGYYPSWVNETQAFLDDAAYDNYNVIMWSWCGQLSGYDSTTLWDRYLVPMDQFEKNNAGITFIYMTGHADGSGEDGTLHINNRHIRKFCVDSGKVLFDFYDIECYDPDDNYFGDKDVTDACNYDGGNWATEWRSAHTENADWYSCSSAHSDALNANMKAYAIWWLWARLGGWSGSGSGTTSVAEAGIKSNLNLSKNYPNPCNGTTKIQFNLEKPSKTNITIFNQQGAEVTKYNLGQRPQGINEYELSLVNQPAGIYYYKISTEFGETTKKLMIN